MLEWRTDGGATVTGPGPDARILAEFYSSAAEDYRRLWAPELLSLSRALLAALPLREAATVLDLGSGVGALLPEIRGRAPRAVVWGVDVAEGMISLAPAEFPRAVMDAMRLGFAGGVFDVAVCAFVLFHLPDPGGALEETARVLGSLGALGTITWGEEPPYPALQIWNEELDRAGAAPIDPPISRHELVNTPAKIETLVEAAGFSGVRTWTGRYVNEMTPDEFLDHHTGHGMGRRRYLSLDAGGRARVVERVQERIAGLDSDGLIHRAEVVYATAHAPP